MRSRPIRHDNSFNEYTAALDNIMDKLFRQAKAQFGPAMKSFWFYDGDLCPACVQHPIGAVKFKGKDALSINAYVYRERGVLIGYFLCETCAKYIFAEAQKNPYHQTPIHADIEHNLIASYHKHLASLNA